MIDTLIHAAVEVAIDNDRAVNLQRPSRGTHGSAVREAARFPQSLLAFAQCVAFRESGVTNLENRQSREDAQNGGSSAAGRWQMLDASGWRNGLSWLVFKRIVKFGVPRAEAHRVRTYLRATPIHKVDGFWQDIAFIQSVEEGGWANWRNGDRCDRLAPR